MKYVEYSCDVCGRSLRQDKAEMLVLDMRVASHEIGVDGDTAASAKCGSGWTTLHICDACVERVQGHQPGVLVRLLEFLRINVRQALRRAAGTWPEDKETGCACKTVAFGGGGVSVSGSGVPEPGQLG